MSDNLIDIKKQEKPDERIAINNQIIALGRRLLIAETKLSNISGKSGLFETNFIDVTAGIKKDLSKLNQELSDLKTEVQKINDTQKLVIEELKIRAKESDLKTLEKYVEFFNAIKYVTENEVKKIVLDEIENISSKIDLKLNNNINLISKQISEVIAKDNNNQNESVDNSNRLHKFQDLSEEFERLKVQNLSHKSINLNNSDDKLNNSNVRSSNNNENENNFFNNKDNNFKNNNDVIADKTKKQHNINSKEHNIRLDHNKDKSISNDSSDGDEENDRLNENHNNPKKSKKSLSDLALEYNYMNKDSDEAYNNKNHDDNEGDD